MLSTFFSKIDTKNLYLYLLFVQILDVVNSLVLSDLVKQNLVHVPQIIIQFALITLANGLALLLVRRFIHSNVLFGMFCFLILSSIIFMFITESPARAQFEIDRVSQLRQIGFVFQLFTLSMIAFVFMRDIFETKHDLVYCLTGACTFFFLIGTVFAVLYALFYAFFPTLIQIPIGSNVITPCLNYSFCVLAGQDTPLPVDLTIKSLSYLESIFSNLFAVVVVGKLLTK